MLFAYLETLGSVGEHRSWDIEDQAQYRVFPVQKFTIKNETSLLKTTTKKQKQKWYRY